MMIPLQTVLMYETRPEGHVSASPKMDNIGG